MFSDRPDTNHTGGLGYTFDDHRDAHIDVHVLDLAFARAIAVEIHRLVGDPRVKRLIVCASPRMLGDLRRVSDSLPRKGLTIDEIARNLVQLTPPELREQLSSYGLLLA